MSTPVAAPTNRPALVEALVRLGRVVDSQAIGVGHLVGFGWTPASPGPDQYPELRRAFRASQVSGRPLPVSADFLGTVIYPEPATNLAFRFWHDVTHVLMGQGFNLDGELEVATAQLDVLRACGYGPGTMEYAVLHADTIGQAICVATTGDFPEDQSCFVRSVIGDGLRLALDQTTTEPALKG